MRDVGFLVWIALLFIGVIGSVASSIRKQAQRNAPPPGGLRTPPRRPVPQPAASMPARLQTPQPDELPQWLERMLASPVAQSTPTAAMPQPAPRAAAPKAAMPSSLTQRSESAPFELHSSAAAHAGKLARLFGNRRDLIRAVIAAEVLGKPRALRDE